MNRSRWFRRATWLCLMAVLYTGLQCAPPASTLAPDPGPAPPPGVTVTPGSGGTEGNGSGHPNNPYTPPPPSTPIGTQTLEIPSVLPWGLWTGTLDAGVTYTIEARGSWFYGDDMEADAKWWRPAGSQERREQHLFRDQGWELLINHERVDWYGTTDGVTFSQGVFSPMHVYRTTYVGEGKAIRIAIEDSLYANNIGSITVYIFR